MAGEIQIMIPQYGELNRIYNDFLISHTFSFDRQKFITDFYKQYNDTKAFEAAILELVLDYGLIKSLSGHLRTNRYRFCPAGNR